MKKNVIWSALFVTYAEAKIELGELDGSVINAFNLVRNRAKQPEGEIAIQGDQNELRQLVRRERVAELAMEGIPMVRYPPLRDCPDCDATTGHGDRKRS